ncbi:MAG: chromosomal replication initiator protein DnaA [Clostridia bacterium]|nr:chromosomal replication initiator protein DnaA [Clostridia bacterium]
MNDLNELWNSVLAELSKTRSQLIMKLMFNSLTLRWFDGSNALLTSENTDFLTMLNSKYSPEIADVFYKLTGEKVRVSIHAEEGFDAEKILSGADGGKSVQSGPAAEKKPLPNPDYTFDNFVVGSSNKFAHAAAVAVCAQPAAAYNPLFIYGQSGVGKTHLLYAITNEISKKFPDFNIVYIKGEEFTNQLIEAISKNRQTDFREKFRRADVLLVDDIQFIAGKNTTQEEFFHTFNTLFESHRQIILTSDLPPKDIQTLEDRLKTRFEWGLTVDVPPPDIELRIAILKRKSENMGLDLPNDVLIFLGENLNKNVRQIEGALKKLGAYSLITGERITLETAQAQLSDIISDTEPQAQKIDRIISMVSQHTGVPEEEIKGKKRTKEIAMARHICIYMLRTQTELSFPSIGKIFGRDHSTIMYSIDLIQNRIDDDNAFSREMTELANEMKR